MSTPQKSLFSLLPLCKNFHNRSKFDKVLTKNMFAVFLRHGVYSCNIALCCKLTPKVDMLKRSLLQRCICGIMHIRQNIR